MKIFHSSLKAKILILKHEKRVKVMITFYTHYQHNERSDSHQPNLKKNISTPDRKKIVISPLSTIVARKAKFTKLLLFLLIVNFFRMIT